MRTLNLFVLLCLVGLSTAKLRSSSEGDSSSSVNDHSKILNEDDFKKLEKEFLEEEKEAEQDDEDEDTIDVDGSGDDEDDEDDEDYDDDEEYDEDEYDDEEEDYESSGDEDDEDLEKIADEDEEDEINLDEGSLSTRKHEDEFHFEEDLDETKATDDDLLSEYYDEEYEPDYYENEDYKNDWVIKEEIRPEVHAGMPTHPTSGEKHDVSLDGLVTKFFTQFKLSYIYIMLASAFISFALVLAMFFLCRRSALERQRMNAKLVPFVVSDPRTMRPSPIVKNYQRVPTSTREFMGGSGDTRVVEMPASHPSKPLLT